MSGGFLVIGALLCIFSVVTPRLEGQQEFTLTGAKMTLAIIERSIDQGEKEIERGELLQIEEVLGERG